MRITCTECGAKTDYLTGMYGQTPRVQVGKYSISEQFNDSVWIEREDGEGAAFSIHVLEERIEALYNLFF